jgi:hypothetical protein
MNCTIIEKKKGSFFGEIEDDTIYFLDLLTFSVYCALRQLFWFLSTSWTFLSWYALAFAFIAFLDVLAVMWSYFLSESIFQFFIFLYWDTHTFQYYSLRYDLLESRFCQEVFLRPFSVVYIYSMHGWRPARMTTCVINQVAKRASSIF